jgi:HNH endonuclease
MSAVYASTTPTWFDQLALIKPERVAFWQPTPARPARIAPGERWYFKELGAPRILGYGEFVGWEQLSALELFGKYGAACGYASVPELVGAFRVFDPDVDEHTPIGNVILENFTPFDPPLPLDNVNLKDLTVRFVYLEGPDPIASYVAGLRPSAAIAPFTLRDSGLAKRVAAARKVRVGQAAFRRLLIDVYGPVCALTGPQLEETLQAAHIQPYVDAESNHLSNGLVLRADMHVLFDLGLVTLTADMHIRVSTALQGRAPLIEALHGTKAKLTSKLGLLPSPEAIGFHAREVFEP